MDNRFMNTPPSFAAQNPPPLVRKIPPPTYAHTVKSFPMAQTLPNAARTLGTIGQVARYQPVKDSQLANLDDNMKRFGSILIATLATLGLKQKIFGVNEYLGFASWFAAMGITPKIINGLIQLKTGVNLSQQYQSSYGTRENLFKDPNYLPLHVLSDDQINKAADKLGIPKDHPDRRKATEDKMRQIAVQGRTWWMLVAGPATPVISGAICDLLQDPVTKLVNAVKASLAQGQVSRAVSAGNADKVAARSEKYLAQLVGTVPESELSMWWKDFGRAMSEKTGLKKSLSISEVVDSKQEKLVQRMVEHFEKLDPASEGFSSLEEYLNGQKERLAALDDQAKQFLDGLDGKMSAEAVKRQQNFVNIRLNNARSTLTHYEKLLEALKAGEKGEVRKLMQKPVLAEVQRLIDTGFVNEAKKLVGDDAIFRKIRNAIEIRQFGEAFKLMGASPAAHLATSLKDSMLRRLWRKRILGYLGGGMLLATTIFTQFFVGRDFKPKAVKPGEGAPR